MRKIAKVDRISLIEHFIYLTTNYTRNKDQSLSAEIHAFLNHLTTRSNVFNYRSVYDILAIAIQRTR